MEEASYVALISGFGGVVLGGVITYISESHFRKKERQERIRGNFSLVIAELGRTTDDLYSIYSSLTDEMPEKQPDFFFSNTRMMATVSVELASVSAEKVFCVSDTEDNLFSDVSLSFRRFNSTIATLKSINEHRALFQKSNQKNVTKLGEQDVASFELSENDTESVMALVRIENLYRSFFASLIQDIESNIALIDRVNKVSARKFSTKDNKNPKLELEIEFSPIDYLRKPKFFDMSQLKKIP